MPEDAMRGVVRRFEIRGSAFGATIVDDYAHHPSEVAAAIAAARALPSAEATRKALAAPRFREGATRRGVRLH